MSLESGLLLDKRKSMIRLGDTIDANDNVKRLVELWDATAPSTRVDGNLWYLSAHDFAQRLARDYNVTLEQSAGVIAALSPQVSWSRNKGLAEEFLAGNDVHTFGAAKRKASGIVAGVVSIDKRTAPKTFCFQRNIVNPLDDAWVAIDRHAYSAWLGEKCVDVKHPNDSRPTVPHLARANRYWTIMEDFRSAAKVISNIAPSAFQATIWLHWREL